MINKEIAKDLLSIEAVFLKPEDPFTWGKRNQKSNLL